MTLGIRPAEERALAQARQNDSAFLGRWLAGLDDVIDRHNDDLRAVRHLPRQSALAAGRLDPGSWPHLDDLEFRDGFAGATEEQRQALMRRVVDELEDYELTATERAATLGISRTTEWRRRKARKA